MEGLITKALAKYFNLFIKNFVKENFNISLFKGEGRLQNLDLNEKVLQELLMIPPNMEVKSATCNDLFVQVNWTRLKHDPITITLDKIDVYLSEPTEVSAMPDLLAAFSSKSTGKKMSQLDTMLDVTLIINSISFKMQNLPTVRSTWTPILEISIKNVCLQSTNSQWQVVDLAKAKGTDPNDKDITLIYKQLNAKAITVSLHTENNHKISLLEESPITVHMISRWKLKDGIWMGVNMEVIINQLVLNTTVNEWEYLVDFNQSIRHCFARPVPEKPVVQSPIPSTPKKEDKPATPPVETGYETAYGLTINKWAIEIMESNKENPALTQVFDFEGPSGLKFVFSKSKRLKTQEKLKFFAYETFITFSLPTISLRRTVPSTGVVTTLLSQQSGEYQRTSDLIASKMYWKVQPNMVDGEIDTSGQMKLIELQYNLRLDSAQVLLERGGWYELYSLFKRNIKSSNVAADDKKFEEEIMGEEDKAKIAQRFKDKLREKMSMLMDWNDISFNFEAAHLKLMIPEMSSNITIDKLALTNSPKWKEVPLLGKAPRFVRELSEDEKAQKTKGQQKQKSLPPPPPPKKTGNEQAPTLPPKPNTQAQDLMSMLLSAPSEAPAAAPAPAVSAEPSAKVPPPLPPKEGSRSRSNSLEKVPPPLPPKLDSNAIKTAVSTRITANTVYRVEADLEGVAIDVSTSPLDTQTVFRTEKCNLYGLFYQEDEAEYLSDAVTVSEVVLNAGAVELKVNDSQFFQFYSLYRSYEKSIEETFMSKSAQFEEIKNKIKEKLKEKVEEGKEAFNKNNLPDIDSIKTKVESTLQKRKIAFLFKADKGVFDLPMRSIMNIQNLDSPKMRNKLASLDKKKHLIPLRFDDFELGFENTSERQNFMLKLKSMHLRELNYKGSPQTLTFEPLASNSSEGSIYRMFSLNTDDNANFRLFYSRISPKSESDSSLSEIWIRLEDMHIIMKNKTEEELELERAKKAAKAEVEKAESSVPGIQAMINKLVGIIDSRKGDLMSNLETLKGKETLIKDNIEKLKFSLKWQVEMGDCEVVYGEKSDTDTSDAKPTGVVKVCNTGLINQVKHRFLEMENQLIHTKTQVANIQQENQEEIDELSKRVRELEAKLQAANKERGVWEEKYIDVKMKMSEIEMQNQDMQRSLFTLEKKASGQK